MSQDGPSRAVFEAFVDRFERPLRIALTSLFGQDGGREATAEALAYAWENWDRVSRMDNPAGYLYKVGRSSQRRKKEPKWLPMPEAAPPHFEPGLPAALAGLSNKQRTAVVLVHAYGWTRNEVADMTGISLSAIDTHLARGLSKLRSSLGVATHA